MFDFKILGVAVLNYAQRKVCCNCIKLNITKKGLHTKRLPISETYKKQLVSEQGRAKQGFFAVSPPYARTRIESKTLVRKFTLFTLFVYSLSSFSKSYRILLNFTSFIS
jgi:hypothetical protein